MQWWRVEMTKPSLQDPSRQAIVAVLAVNANEAGRQARQIFGAHLVYQVDASPLNVAWIQIDGNLRAVPEHEPV